MHLYSDGTQERNNSIVLGNQSFFSLEDRQHLQQQYLQHVQNNTITTKITVTNRTKTSKPKN